MFPNTSDTERLAAAISERKRVQESTENHLKHARLQSKAGARPFQEPIKDHADWRRLGDSQDSATD